MLLLLARFGSERGDGRSIAAPFCARVLILRHAQDERVSVLISKPRLPLALSVSKGACEVQAASASIFSGLFDSNRICWTPK